ncbi:carbon storage regulator CsrA [Viridibacillus sp. NPDC096237]|uniref:carbon storage regulator CsrA n=1 Tax=Viridibacillus sp. NPDC096237 TaxID=3390721 RepID=UPI003D071A63
MLVLTRKTGESIMIGDNIELKVLTVEGDHVKLGIVAPKSIKVHRSEVYQAIQEQNKEAVNTPKHLLAQLSKKIF